MSLSILINSPDSKFHCHVSPAVLLANSKPPHGATGFSLSGLLHPHKAHIFLVSHKPCTAFNLRSQVRPPSYRYTYPRTSRSYDMAGVWFINSQVLRSFEWKISMCRQFPTILGGGEIAEIFLNLSVTKPLSAPKGQSRDELLPQRKTLFSGKVK